MKFILIPVTGAVMVMGLSDCTKHDQVLDLTTSTTPTPVLDLDTLYSGHGTAALQPIGGAAWDGTIEAVWNTTSKLTVHAVVPDLGNGTFEGFVGHSTDITMRSLYDATNIYFLVEFNTPQKNVRSAQWYYNPTLKRWAQESGSPVLNSDGVTFRPPFQQDGFTMAFNIANSSQTFNAQSCYSSCHVNSSYGTTTIPAGGAMYTNGPTEFLDCWRARMLQIVNMNQANDVYIDWGGGVLDKNEFHNDLQVNNGPVPIADGGFSNKQSIKMTGTATKVSVPLWVKTSGSYSNSAILLNDTLPGGAAIKVTAVDTNGVLTLSDLSTIDPRTAASGTNYQQVGADDGAKCVPGSIIGAYTGSRGDVTANAFYTGTGWRLLLKRALNTGDNAYDVDFSSLYDKAFGVGAMFNGANGEHAIVAGLTLSFRR